MAAATLTLVSLTGVSAFATTGLVDSDTAIKYVQFQENGNGNNGGNGDDDGNGNGNGNNDGNGDGNGNGNGNGNGGNGSGNGNGAGDGYGDGNGTLPNTGEASQVAIAVAGLTGLAATAYVASRKFN